MEKTYSNEIMKKTKMLYWELIRCSGCMNVVFRTKVPGGWFVTTDNMSILFYPDPEHQWDGSSMEYFYWGNLFKFSLEEEN
jgi:hypothetical protein